MSGQQRYDNVIEGEVEYSIEKQLYLNDSDYDLKEYFEYQSPRFLIVEDEPISQKILTEYSKNSCQDVQCFVASSAKDALRILDSTIIDLIVSDYFLEGYYTGLDLWYSASSLHPETEFIITSQMKLSQYLDIVSGVKYPPSFLAKPLSFDRWKRLMVNTIAGGKYERDFE